MSGPAGPAPPTRRVHCHHTSIKSTELESLVRNFFDSEQLPEERSHSEEEQWVIEHFKSTHIRKEDGTYQVRLPLKSLFDPNQTLGESQQMALNRFQQLDRKLHRNPEHQKRYADGIQEYFDLNQIKRAFSTEQQHCTLSSTSLPTVTSSVLPHHAIIKEDSLTTKFRIVFDASAKTSNGRFIMCRPTNAKRFARRSHQLACAQVRVHRGYSKNVQVHRNASRRRAVSTYLVV